MRPADLNRNGTGRAIVTIGLGCFVLGVYVVVVLGGGLLVGHTDVPSPALSVLATAVVALAFAPVQEGARTHRFPPESDAVRRVDPVRPERRHRG